MKYLDYSDYQKWREEHHGRFGDTARGAERLHPDYIGVKKFFGTNGLAPEDIRIDHQTNQFEIVDPFIASFAQDVAAKMRAEGRLYDGPPAAKLVKYDFSSDRPSITIQPVDYALQAGTCFALDLPDNRFAAWGGSLRDYYRQTCTEPTPANNPLAICLGVCGMLVIEEGKRRYLLSVTRSSRLASLAGTVGPSVAGVVDYRADYRTLHDLNEVSLGAEVCEELALRSGEFEIVPLGWALELYRGERPQIFSLIKTTLSRGEVSNRLESIDEQSREFESYQFVEIKAGRTIEESNLNFEAVMNWRLAMEYLGL